MNMKVYLLLLLVVTALALGCVDKKPSETIPVSTETPLPPELTDNEASGIENDLAQMDSLFNDSSLEISLSEVSADAFT